MLDPWRRRCPKGHSATRINRSTYRCVSCGGVYPGDPYDAAETDFPVDPADDPEAEMVERPDDEEILEALVRACDDPTTTWVRARRLTDAPARFVGQALARLDDEGLVRGISHVSQWQPTAKGRERVADEASAAIEDEDGFRTAKRAGISPYGGVVLVGAVVLLYAAAVIGVMLL